MDQRPPRRTTDGLAPLAHPVRWGLGDFLLIYLVGVVISLVGNIIGVAISGTDGDDATALTLALTGFGQFGGWVAGAYLVARYKGRSLRVDFGFTVRIRDWWAVFVGIGLFVAASIFLLPLVEIADDNQQVVNELNNAGGAKLAVFALLAGIVAPVCEELLFRGVLLRALRRRMSVVGSVAVSAFIFAIGHWLLSPTLGDLAVVPALFAFGAAAGVAAVRRGDLSAAILMHFGFNLVTTVAALS